jgi:hypothetical protein
MNQRPPPTQPAARSPWQLQTPNNENPSQLPQKTNPSEPTTNPPGTQIYPNSAIPATRKAARTHPPR